MTDDRSERLRKRRKQSRERRRSRAPGERSSGDEERTDGRGVEAAADDPASGSVKEEQTGTYMYLPTSQAKRLRRVYNILKAEYEFEFDEEFEKNRHFYPLVVAYGLEHLEGMDAAEIRDHLETLDR